MLLTSLILHNKKGSNTLLVRILPPFHTSNTAYSLIEALLHSTQSIFVLFLKIPDFALDFSADMIFKQIAFTAQFWIIPSPSAFSRNSLYFHILQCSFLQAVFFHLLLLQIKSKFLSKQNSESIASYTCSSSIWNSCCCFSHFRYQSGIWSTTPFHLQFSGICMFRIIHFLKPKHIVSSDDQIPDPADNEGSHLAKGAAVFQWNVIPNIRHIVCGTNRKVLSDRSNWNCNLTDPVTVVGSGCHIITAQKDWEITAAKDLFHWLSG